jgi:hypothetical protein
MNTYILDHQMQTLTNLTKNPIKINNTIHNYNNSRHKITNNINKNHHDNHIKNKIQNNKKININYKYIEKDI